MTIELGTSPIRPPARASEAGRAPVRALKRTASSLSCGDLLDRSAWFTALGAAGQAEVRRTIGEQTVAGGEALSHQGDMQHHWVGVLEGLVTWSIVTADGRSVSMSGQAPGSWFGEGTLLRGQPRQSELLALRRSRVALIPRDVFHGLRAAEPSFDKFLLLQINERLHWFMGNFAAYGLLDADRLVARALAGLVHPLLNPVGDRYLQVTQEELAKLASVSRPRCNASLTNLKQRRLIELDYGAVTVLDIDGLHRFSVS